MHHESRRDLGEISTEISARSRVHPAQALERTNTLLGSILTQLIMIATMVTVAATRDVTGSTRLDSVDDIADALAVSLGQTAAKARHSSPVRLIL